jgi:hypothetical protein
VCRKPRRIGVKIENWLKDAKLILPNTWQSKNNYSKYNKSEETAGGSIIGSYK